MIGIVLGLFEYNAQHLQDQDDGHAQSQRLLFLLQSFDAKKQDQVVNANDAFQ